MSNNSDFLDLSDTALLYNLADANKTYTSVIKDACMHNNSSSEDISHNDAPYSQKQISSNDFHVDVHHKHVTELTSEESSISEVSPVKLYIMGETEEVALNDVDFASYTIQETDRPNVKYTSSLSECEITSLNYDETTKEVDEDDLKVERLLTSVVTNMEGAKDREADTLFNGMQVENGSETDVLLDKELTLKKMKHNESVKNVMGEVQESTEIMKENKFEVYAVRDIFPAEKGGLEPEKSNEIILEEFMKLKEQNTREVSNEAKADMEDEKDMVVIINQDTRISKWMNIAKYKEALSLEKEMATEEGSHINKTEIQRSNGNSKNQKSPSAEVESIIGDMQSNYHNNSTKVVAATDIGELMKECVDDFDVPTIESIQPYQREYDEIDKRPKKNDDTQMKYSEKMPKCIELESQKYQYSTHPKLLKELKYANKYMMDERKSLSDSEEMWIYESRKTYKWTDQDRESRDAVSKSNNEVNPKIQFERNRNDDFFNRSKCVETDSLGDIYKEEIKLLLDINESQKREIIRLMDLREASHNDFKLEIEDLKQQLKMRDTQLATYEEINNDFMIRIENLEISVCNYKTKNYELLAKFNEVECKCRIQQKEITKLQEEKIELLGSKEEIRLEKCELAKKVTKLEEKIQKQYNEITTITTKLECTNESLKNKKSQLDSIKANIAAINEEALQQMKSEIKQAEDATKKVKEKLRNSENIRGDLANRIHKLEEALRLSEERESELKIEIEELKNINKKHEAKLLDTQMKLGKDIGEKQAEIMDLLSRNDKYREDINLLQDQIESHAAPLISHITRLEKDLEQERAYRCEEKISCNDLNNRITIMVDEITKLKDSLNDCNDHLNKEIVEKETYKILFDEKSAVYERALEDMRGLKMEMEEAKKQVEEYDVLIKEAQLNGVSTNDKNEDKYEMMKQKLKESESYIEILRKSINEECNNRKAVELVNRSLQDQLQRMSRKASSKANSGIDETDLQKRFDKATEYIEELSEELEGKNDTIKLYKRQLSQLTMQLSNYE